MAQPPESLSRQSLPEDPAALQAHEGYRDETLTAASDHYVRLQAAEQQPPIPDYATPDRVDFFRGLMADESSPTGFDHEATVSGLLQPTASVFLTPPKPLEEPEPAPPMRRPKPGQFRESDLWKGRDADELLRTAREDLGKVVAFLGTVVAQPQGPPRPPRPIRQPAPVPPHTTTATRIGPPGQLPSFGGTPGHSTEKTQLFAPVTKVRGVSGSDTSRPS